MNWHLPSLVSFYHFGTFSSSLSSVSCQEKYLLPLFHSSLILCICLWHFSQTPASLVKDPQSMVSYVVLHCGDPCLVFAFFIYCHNGSFWLLHFCMHNSLLYCFCICHLSSCYLHFVLDTVWACLSFTSNIYID